MSICIVMLYCCAAAVLILDVWVIAAAKRGPTVCFATVCVRFAEGISPPEYLVIYTTLEFSSVSPRPSPRC
jgi:hypothetical protein